MPFCAKRFPYDLAAAVFPSEAERLRVMYSVSEPMAQFLLEKLPEDAQAFLQSSFEKPAFCVRVNTLKTSVEELQRFFEQQGIAAQEGEVKALCCSIGTEA